MTIEEEMRFEIRRLEKEIDSIDTEMEKHQTRILELISSRKKKEHDLRILRSNFELVSQQDIQTTLDKLI